MTHLHELKHRTVGIAGCGGLGSNCAVALARAGVGKLVIADFDVVSQGNLNRQYFFLDQLGQKKVDALQKTLEKINSNIRVETHDERLSPENIPAVFSQCEVIVEAFDDAGMKQMILETVSSVWPEKYLVMGIGLAGWGYTDALKVSRYGYLFVCGDREKEVSDILPPLAPRVGIVAHMQANTVLEILLDILPRENDKH